MESALLGACGGLLDATVGIDIGALVAIYQGWTVMVDPLPVAFGPLMGVVIGTLAGVYPAWAASRVVPAVSLRT